MDSDLATKSKPELIAEIKRLRAEIREHRDRSCQSLDEQNPDTSRVELNHTIVNVKDKEQSASFFAEILGLPPAQSFLGYFLVLRTSNGVSLDFIDSTEKIEPQHYAFLVSEKQFDQIFNRIKTRGITYWADPAQKHPGQINTHDGGRGCYFEEPSGHFLEIITRPYGMNGT